MKEIPDHVEAEMRDLLQPDRRPRRARGPGIRQAVLRRVRRRTMIADLAAFSLFRIWNALFSLLVSVASAQGKACEREHAEAGQAAFASAGKHGVALSHRDQR